VVTLGAGGVVAVGLGLRIGKQIRHCAKTCMRMRAKGGLRHPKVIRHQVRIHHGVAAAYAVGVKATTNIEWVNGQGRYVHVFTYSNEESKRCSVCTRVYRLCSLRRA
jgi:hypothetical protein